MIYKAPKSQWLRKCHKALVGGWVLCCRDSWADSSCLSDWIIRIGFIYGTNIRPNTNTLFGLQFRPNRIFSTAV